MTFGVWSFFLGGCLSTRYKNRRYVTCRLRTTIRVRPEWYHTSRWKGFRPSSKQLTTFATALSKPSTAYCSNNGAMAHTMALLDAETAKQMKVVHFSAQHHADSKGKQEG